MFSSLRSVLEASLSPEALAGYLGPDPEALWRKVDNVIAMLEAASKSDKKQAKLIIRGLEKKLGQCEEMMAFME